MWYDMTPASYAEGLRLSAIGSDECAARKATEGKPWSAYDADFYRRQARRLRAMALLCDRSTAARAGEIDFRRLSDPTHSREDEDRVVAEIEGGH